MNLLETLVPVLLTAGALSALAAPPAVGEKAPDFSLSTLDGRTVRLSAAVSQGPVVLVMLRGFPGYQCPLCNRQVHDFLRNAKGFVRTRVMMVYPGTPQDLGTRAQEFMADKTFPENFELLLDPGYEFTNLYGLRWDAPQETAYPATFLINARGVVFYSKISRSHGGRTNAAEILDALRKHKTEQQ